MNKTYTYNDIVWYLIEVGACESNYSVEPYIDCIDAILPENWESDINITTTICVLLNLYITKWPNTNVDDLINYVVIAANNLYFPVAQL